MTPLLPGLWFLVLALAVAWVARRLDDDLPRRAVVACLVLTVLLLAPALFGGAVLSSPRLMAAPPFGDDPDAAVAALQHDPSVRVLPFERQLRRTLLAGHAPWWNPLHGAGTPLLAAPEAQAGQPFAVAAWPLPPGPGLVVTAALQLFTALLFGWLALRRYAPFTEPPGSAAALAGAAVYALLAVVPVHGWPQANAAALLPAALYALLRLAAPHRRRHRLLAVAAVAALLLSGAPRTALVVATVVAALFVSHLARRPASRRGRPARRAAAALLLAAALAAPVLLPAARWLPHTESSGHLAAQRYHQLHTDPLGLKALRLHQHGAPSWGGGQPPWPPLAHGSVLLLAALALARPSTWRRPELHPAVTAVPLLLGAAGLAAVLAPASLAGVLSYLRLAPDPRTGSPAFPVVAFVLALLVTAALSDLAAPAARRPGQPRVVAAGLVTAACLLILARQTPTPPLLLPVAAAAATVLLALARALRPRAAVLLPLLLMLPVAETVTAALPRPTTPAAVFARPLPFETPEDGPLFRTAVFGIALPPGTAQLHDLPDARAVPGARPRVYGELLRDMERPPGFFTGGSDQMYDLLGVRTLISDGVATDRPSALPRFFLPTASRSFAAGGGVAWRRALHERGDVGHTSLVQVRPETTHHRGPWRAATPEDDRLRTTALAPHRWRLEVRLGEERLLASSLYQDGGWRLRLDGRPHPVFLANGPFLAAWLPAGEHTLEVVYRPPWLAAGLLLAALGAAALVPFVARRERG